MNFWFLPKEVPALLLAVLVASCLLFGQEPRKYQAPDGSELALVIPISKNQEHAQTESIVQIRKADGTVLSTRNFSSRDGQHGEAVSQAGWTADSQFFVFSTSLTGGHQPWHFPTYFYSRRLQKIQSLDALVGPILTPDFKLVFPDIVKTQTWVKPGDLTPRPLTVKLNGLRNVPPR